MHANRNAFMLCKVFCIHMYVCRWFGCSKFPHLCHPSKLCLPIVRVSLQGTQSSSWLERSEATRFQASGWTNPIEKHIRLVISNVNWTIVNCHPPNFEGENFKNTLKIETTTKYQIYTYFIHPNTYAVWNLFNRWMHICTYNEHTSITPSISLCLKVRDPWKKGGVANKKQYPYQKEAWNLIQKSHDSTCSKRNNQESTHRKCRISLSWKNLGTSLTSVIEK